MNVTPKNFVRALNLKMFEVEHAFVSLSPQFNGFQKQLTDPNHLSLKFTGFGSPSAVAQAEILFARGLRHFIFYGSAGSFTAEAPIGSVGYVMEASKEGECARERARPSAFWTQAFHKKLEHSELPKWKSLTTDFLFNERTEGQGCDIVEMEAHALYSWAHSRGAEAIVVCVIQDELFHSEWKLEARQKFLFDKLAPHLLNLAHVSV